MAIVQPGSVSNRRHTYTDSSPSTVGPHSVPAAFSLPRRQRIQSGKGDCYDGQNYATNSPVQPATHWPSVPAELKLRLHLGRAERGVHRSFKKLPVFVFVGAFFQKPRH
ncbi:unnamed protein product [Arctogadus glacialis]